MQDLVKNKLLELPQQTIVDVLYELGGNAYSMAKFFGVSYQVVKDYISENNLQEDAKKAKTWHLDYLEDECLDALEKVLKNDKNPWLQLKACLAFLKRPGGTRMGWGEHDNSEHWLSLKLKDITSLQVNRPLKEKTSAIKRTRKSQKKVMIA